MTQIRSLDNNRLYNSKRRHYMTHKSHLGILLASVSAVVLAIGVAVIGNSNNAVDFAKADPTSYTVNLNSYVFGLSGLNGDYQTEVVQDNLGEGKPVLHYFIAKKDNSGNLVLAPNGKLFNYSDSATYKGRITNIESIAITYSGGALFIQEGIGGEGTQYDTKHALESGVKYDTVSSPNYVMISNSTAETTITNVEVKYSCEEAGYVIERFGKTYNGKGADGTTYIFERSGSSITVNGALTGTIAVDGSANVSISLAGGTMTYSGKVSADYKTITIFSKTGEGPTINELNRVYIMDDFEGYAHTGNRYQAHTNKDTTPQDQFFLKGANAATQASDLRAAYYSDYQGGGYNTWVTNSSFSVCTGGDYANLVTNVKHSGNKAMTLKGSTNGWMRYWSSEVFNQNQHYNFGQGNKLSFWAHGAYSNTACTNDSALNVTLRVQVYYQNFSITDGNRGSTTYGSGTTDIPVNAGTGWQEYSFNIDPNRKVYAINFMVNQTSASAYIPIDDITIYTNPVYEPAKKLADTAERFSKAYHGPITLSLMGQSYNFELKVNLGSDGFVSAYAATDMGATGYTVTGDTIVIETSGSYMGKTFGTWTGTLSNNKSTITIQKSNITGTVQSNISTSTIVLTENEVLVSGNEASISTIENKIIKQKQDGSGDWIDDTDNDRMSITDKYSIHGYDDKALRVKPNSTVNLRLILNPTYAENMSKNLDNIGFWFYVPVGYSYQLMIFTYKDAVPTKTSGRYAQPGTVSYDGRNIEEAGWHYYEIGLNKKDGYGKNFAIFIQSTAGQTVLDYINVF